MVRRVAPARRLGGREALRLGLAAAAEQQRTRREQPDPDRRSQRP